MDYEEFLLATGNNTFSLLRELYKTGKSVGEKTNRKLMRDFRIYMAVGGMPQAVDAYVSGKNFEEIDKIKRGILKLYENVAAQMIIASGNKLFYHTWEESRYGTRL